jgi:hypothetical protein
MPPQRGKKIDDPNGSSSGSNSSKSKLSISPSSSFSARGLPSKNSNPGLPSATQSHDAQLDRAPMLARACAPQHKSDHQGFIDYSYQPYQPQPPRAHKPEPGAQPGRASRTKMRTPDPNQEIISAERFIQGKPIPYKSSDLSGPFATSSQPDEYFPSVEPKKPKNRDLVRCVSPPSVRRPSLVDLPQIPLQRPESRAMERVREQAPGHTITSLTNLQKSKGRKKSIPTEEERLANKAADDERKSKLVAKGQRISPTEDGRRSKLAAEGRRISITEFDPRTERRGSLAADCDPRMTKVAEYDRNMAKPATYSRHCAKTTETHRGSIPTDERRNSKGSDGERPPVEQGRRKSIPVVLPMKQQNIIYNPGM